MTTLLSKKSIKAMVKVCEFVANMYSKSIILQQHNIDVGLFELFATF